MCSRLFRPLHRNGVTKQLEAKIFRIAAAHIDNVQAAEDARPHQVDGVDIRESTFGLGTQTAPVLVQVPQRIVSSG
jgi:hypothetical protein